MRRVFLFNGSFQHIHYLYHYVRIIRSWTLYKKILKHIDVAYTFYLWMCLGWYWVKNSKICNAILKISFCSLNYDLVYWKNLTLGNARYFCVKIILQMWEFLYFWNFCNSSIILLGISFALVNQRLWIKLNMTYYNNFTGKINSQKKVCFTPVHPIHHSKWM